MKPVFFILWLLSAGFAAASNITERSVLNGPCTGAGGAPGVCIHKGACGSGAKFIDNACPETPDDVKCCTKTSCGSAGGNCRFTSQCASGNTQSGLCPGPADFKCCLPTKTDPNPKPPTKAPGLAILAKAKEAVGVPYRFGSGSCSGPTGNPKSFDCSGLVSWAVCQVTHRSLFDENLRETYKLYCASESKSKYKKIPFSQRRAGDAVFFGPNKCRCPGRDVHHVALMLDSGTRIWNALNKGTKVREDNFKNWPGRDAPCPYVIRF
ncbi:hypothetical protein B0T24DRAFT_582012 [Lasiosphaeria ovina]|uniref:NlpC/P60 domain-containing protein n=1 Tax=Lasiosphaeria ovina TaxID=92902 RepID=A0AAE0K0G7_9PEZI|nr:hypothetical protein B0T24DRAFT_582012 [Lasiosphaeria ovina]